MNPAEENALAIREEALIKKMDHQQLAFCHAVLSGTQYYEAYHKVYRPEADVTDKKEKRFCARQAARLMHRVEIRDYLEHRTGQAAETAIVSLGEMLSELLAIIYDPDTPDNVKISAIKETIGIIKGLRAPEKKQDTSELSPAVILSLKELILRA